MPDVASCFGTFDGLPHASVIVPTVKHILTSYVYVLNLCLKFSTKLDCLNPELIDASCIYLQGSQRPADW